MSKYTCCKCKQEKASDDFYPSFLKRGRMECRECRKEYSRQWHKDTYEERKPHHREYYERNKEEIKLKVKAWKKENWDKIKHERKHNPKVKLPYRIGKTINMKLKKTGAKKSQSTAKYLGCTIAELMTHLENKFQEGMSWDNHGSHGWHIDHIRPCASFDLTDKEQAKQCFHYTNLQPLWAKDNLSKGAKWDD